MTLMFFGQHMYLTQINLYNLIIRDYLILPVLFNIFKVLIKCCKVSQIFSKSTESLPVFTS